MKCPTCGAFPVTLPEPPAAQAEPPDFTPEELKALHVKWAAFIEQRNAKDTTIAQQAERIAALEAERDEWKRKADCPMLKCPYEERAEQLEAQNRALREALEEHGEHSVGCWVFGPEPTCNCGLYAALAPSVSGAPEEKP